MKLKENLTAKIIAVILSYVTAVTLVATAIAVVVMGYYKFYFSNTKTVTAEILADMAQREAYHISNLIDEETNLSAYYNDKNVCYEIIDVNNGKTVDTNYKGQPYIATASSEYYTYEEEVRIDEEGNEYWTTKGIHRFDIKVYIDEKLEKNDIFSVVKKIIEIGFKLRFTMVFILLGALVSFVALLCFLYCASGHREGGIIERNYIDKIPFDILTAMVATIGVLCLLLADSLVFGMVDALIWGFVFGTVCYFLILSFTMSFATRIKTKTLFKNTVVFYIMSFLGKYFKKIGLAVKYIFLNLSLVYKTVAVLCIILFSEFIYIMIAYNSYGAHFLFLLFGIIIANIIGVAVVLYFAVTLQKIKKGGERIAGGDLKYKIDTKYMYADFKEFCQSLNNINKGLQTAVNEKMKSERFKTELITNVSHDIKTPLTSIINYVDLIKKEPCENDNIRQYIGILDRQSSRLKKLVEDLVEASKASTGNLAVNLSLCDAGVLLTQAVGEFEERFAKANLKPILNLPQENVKIMADGRHLWRVFDNLLNNICKYAQPDTRVYLDVAEENGLVKVTFRNISRYQLNAPPDELLERFVRGDSSRNTEGSGLGLSIAKSLTELQNGSMVLSTDGDLFKVVITFQKAQDGC